jgi:rhodanese-related sulfurtransferase
MEVLIMATKKKKKALKKSVKSAPKASTQKKSGNITIIIIALVILAVAAAAGFVVSKAREKSLAVNNVVSTVSPDTITITDTATGKSSKMQVLPASAGNVQIANQATPISHEPPPVDHAKAAIDAAARVSAAAKTGDYSYLLKASDTKETIPHIDIEEAKYLYRSGRAIFVDARGAAEYQESHIRGAVSVPVIATPEEIEKLKGQLAGKVIVTYCHGVGCHLADKSAYKLWDAGYRKVVIFFGGWPKWNEHKLPITTRPPGVANTPVMAPPVSSSPAVR